MTHVHSGLAHGDGEEVASCIAGAGQGGHGQIGGDVAVLAHRSDSGGHAAAEVLLKEADAGMDGFHDCGIITAEDIEGVVTVLDVIGAGGLILGIVHDHLGIFGQDRGVLHTLDGQNGGLDFGDLVQLLEADVLLIPA